MLNSGEEQEKTRTDIKISNAKRVTNDWEGQEAYLKLQK